MCKKYYNHNKNKQYEGCQDSYGCNSPQIHVSIFTKGHPTSNVSRFLEVNSQGVKEAVESNWLPNARFCANCGNFCNISCKRKKRQLK